MKLFLARLICLNTVILLTTCILFGAVDLKKTSNTSFKKSHLFSKSEINFETFSFFEEEEEEHFFDFSLLLNFDHFSFFHKNFDQNSICFFESNHKLLRSNKIPIWIKTRHIII